MTLAGFRYAPWLVFLATAAVRAAVVTGQVLDSDGVPVAGGVIAAVPAAGVPSARTAAPERAIIDQRNREFIPHVLAVRRGTLVSFPNSDRIHHHVYSFSPAKRFEIKLYKGTPAEPIRFDQPGIVVLGCNIHDWMIGYVFITDAPFFAVTDDRGAWFLELPAGDYRLDLWHPDLERVEEPLPETVSATEDRPVALVQRVTLKRTRRSGKPPASLQQEGYRGEP